MAELARPAPTDNDTAAFIEAVHETMTTADADRSTPSEAVRGWLLSWGIESELPYLPSRHPQESERLADVDQSRISLACVENTQSCAKFGFAIYGRC